MPGAVLRILKNGCGSARFHYGDDLLRLMAHDHDGLLRTQRRAGTQHLFNKRAAPRTVQDFGKAGFESGALSGRKDDNGEIVRWHG
jgi:hypothetical protein